MLAEMRRKGSWSGEMSFRKKDGSPGICEMVIVPLWDDYGRTVAALQISRDITELRRLRGEPAPPPPVRS